MVFFRLSDCLKLSDECSPVNMQKAKSGSIQYQDASNVRILTVNCTRNTVPELTALLESCHSQLIHRTESWLKPKIESSEIFSDAWNIYWKDRINGIGGVVFIEVDKNVMTIEIEIESDYEVFWARATGQGGL